MQIIILSAWFTDINTIIWTQQANYCTKGLDIALKYHKISQVPNIYYNIARGHLIKMELDSAIKYINLGFSIADSLQMFDTKFLFYQLYSNYYAYTNDYKKAYEYENLYVWITRNPRK